MELKPGYCKIREDLISTDPDVGVPVGDEYFRGPGLLRYRWLDDVDRFEVYYKGKWQEAYSIDFDF